MNKRIFIYFVFFILVFLNPLAGASHDIRGMWDFKAVITQDNTTLSFYALFIGDPGSGSAAIVSFANNANTPEGLMGDYSVVGDTVQIVRKGGGDTLTGQFTSEDDISGIWVDSGGMESGTWTATKKVLPAGSEVDVRGLWLFVFGRDGYPTWYLGYPGTFTGTKDSGVLEFADIITGSVPLIGNDLNFVVVGNGITITSMAGEENFTATFLDENAMGGLWTSVDFGTGTWGAFRMSLPEASPPFGSMDTPVEGSTVSGSIAVTGWALDDSGLASVKIYRYQEGVPIYIGDASFVEGARPDVALMYPEYPANTRAGWGYMLLTHFLPGEGNGTFVLSAVATDLAGKTTELGTKTIIVDNAHAVKPFGALDTPAQGGVASGKKFLNWGWVLTPQPNAIPTDGSTIHVWVDGVDKGHPTYNNYREDIATLFPGYANSGGAIGYFSLDTTPYTNGVHVIQWTATDNANNTDGIGSRYFTLLNTPSDSAQSVNIPVKKPDFEQISQIAEDVLEPIKIKKGFLECQASLLKKKSHSQCVIQELERFEIQLGDHYADIQGYLSYGDKWAGLPIGSTLDKKSGTFSWSPGPGFLGPYSLVFVLTKTNGVSSKKSITILIEPKIYKDTIKQ